MNQRRSTPQRQQPADSEIHHPALASPIPPIRGQGYYPNVDALLVTDVSGVIVDVNAQMCELMGVTRESLIGTPFKRYTADSEVGEDGIRRVLAEERVVDHLVSLSSPSGSTTLVSFNAATYRNHLGELKGILLSGRQVRGQIGLGTSAEPKETKASPIVPTQLQNQNLQLEVENQRMREAASLQSDFLATLTHELRTPLNGIIGFSELMHDGKAGPVSAKHKEYLGDILTSSRRLQQLLDGLEPIKDNSRSGEIIHD